MEGCPLLLLLLPVLLPMLLPLLFSRGYTRALTQSRGLSSLCLYLCCRRLGQNDELFVDDMYTH